MKDAAIRIRVERDLHASFKAACQAGNRQASDVLREFMRTYAERHQQGQGELFAAGQAKRLSLQKSAGR